MTIERIVRPFESPSPWGKAYIPTVGNEESTPLEARKPCVMEWFGSNSGKYVEVAQPLVYNFTFEDNEEDKPKRKTEKVRIENPNDKDQYVDVERLKEAGFKSKQTGKYFNLQFKDWDNDRGGDYNE